MRQLSAAAGIILITVICIVSYRAHKLEQQLQSKDALIAEYRQAIDAQNAAILSASAESQQRLEAYNELLTKPEKIRYQIRYREIKTNDCADVKDILSDIRVSGF